MQTAKKLNAPISVPGEKGTVNFFGGGIAAWPMPAEAREKVECPHFEDRP
jgi:hypothetical protein